MSDFCLGAHAMACIAQHSDLMDRMAARAGISPAVAAHCADPALWYEARLRCIGCALSQHCTRFLASGQTHLASFCVNRVFFTDLGKQVQQLESLEA